MIFVPLLTSWASFPPVRHYSRARRSCSFFRAVIGVIDEPGLHFLPVALGPHALLIRFFGAVRRVDLRLDQEYLRSEPVNSEEGTPMGIGVW